MYRRLTFPLTLVFAFTASFAAAQAEIPKPVCFSATATEHIALSQLKQSARSPDEVAADLAAAKAALNVIQKIDRATKAGKQSDPTYELAAAAARQAKLTKDPLLAELYRRMAADQLARADEISGRQQAGWAKSLPAPALQYAMLHVARTACVTDTSNTEWLKVQLRKIGWFEIGRYGEKADRAAWVLVQHAPDWNFQSDVLTMLRPLIVTGETRKDNYALLYDRVALAQGKPQRYATQGTDCVNGMFVMPREVEDLAGLEARRRDAGLPPMAEYLQQLQRTYGKCQPSTR